MSLTVTLREARKARRLSQLELSMRVGVSQRHVSFVESGRARPSRELLVAWLQVLGAPLALQNAAMLEAGYAPVYGDSSLGDPVLQQARAAVVRLIESHDPMPALVIDADWNLLHLNRGGQWLAGVLVPWLGELPKGTAMNLLDLLVHPEGFTARVVNLDEVGPSMLAHLREDAALRPGLRGKVEAFAAMLVGRLGSGVLKGGLPRAGWPVLTTRFATGAGELAFFSMFTTFGTPMDITLASLRVEHMFPADEATRAVLLGR